MKAAIVVVHGSRKKEPNETFLKMVQKLQNDKTSKFSMIKPAFLEFADPDISTSVKEIVKEEILDITIYPFFLNTGVHVGVDIPKTIEELKTLYPDVSFKIIKHFGASQKIIEVITNDLQKSLNE